MHRDDILRRVAELVFEFAPEPQASPSTSLRLTDDLGYTSLLLLELATEIALDLDLEPIDVDDLVDVQTVADVLALVDGLVEEVA